MASQKRMVDLDEVLKLLSDLGIVTHTVTRVESFFVGGDASTSSPEHRTLTGLPVELAALKERVETLEKGDELLSPVIDAFNASFNAADARFKKLGNDIAELQAKVRALASPVKLYVTPVGTDRFGAPTCDAFFQAPDPPKPVDKAKWERINAAVKALGEALQKDANRLGVPLGAKIPGGDAYVELCCAINGETNPLRTSGGGK